MQPAPPSTARGGGDRSPCGSRVPHPRTVTGSVASVSAAREAAAREGAAVELHTRCVSVSGRVDAPTAAAPAAACGRVSQTHVPPTAGPAAAEPRSAQPPPHPLPPHQVARANQKKSPIQRQQQQQQQQQQQKQLQQQEQEQEQQQIGQVQVVETSVVESIESALGCALSPRARSVVMRINDIIARCQYYGCLAENMTPTAAEAEAARVGNWSSPTEEEQLMYEVLLSLYSTPIGTLFMSQPGISLSNRCCVLTTQDIAKDAVVPGYTIKNAYNPGTIGRSYFATREGVAQSPEDSRAGGTGPAAGGSSGGTPSRKQPVEGIRGATSVTPHGGAVTGASFSFAEAKARMSAVEENDCVPYCVLKVVSFSLRPELARGIIKDQCMLTKLSTEYLTRVVDVLQDPYLDRAIVITNFQSRGSLVPLAGHLDHDPARFRRITLDVAMGLSALHANRVYHHNLKLENVLLASDGRACIADAGFHRIFASQSPEALIFNGELACLPPEVFDEHGPYYNAMEPMPWPGDDSFARSTVSVSGSVGSGGESLAVAGGGGKVASLPPDRATAQLAQALARVDVWGFGVLLYRLAYGRDPLEIAMRHVEEVRDLVQGQDPVYPPKPLWPFHEELVAVMQACMRKEPARRPDVTELLRMPYFKDLLTMTPSGRIASFRRTQTVASSAPLSSANHSRVLSRPESSSGHSAGQNRKGYGVDARLSSGRFSETLLVHSRSNPSRRFIFKMLTRSINRRMKELQEGTKTNNAVRDARMHDFLRKVAICGKMNHPNIIPFVDIVNSVKGRCFVVQEYLRNGPLLAMPALTSHNPKVPDLERLLGDVLLALVYLHENEVAHLSLRPSNIFYDDAAGRYRVTDFGPLFLTMEEIISANAKGKPIYALPHFLLTRKPANGYHVDVFFLGLLAASAVPVLFTSLWPQVTRRPSGGHNSGGGGGGGGAHGSAAINVVEVMQAVRSSTKPTLPMNLIDFIQQALNAETTARRLLDHPYFNGRFSGSNTVFVERVEVTPEEIVYAAQAKPEAREEPHMSDVIVLDPYSDSQVLSGILPLHSVDCDTSVSVSERPVVVTFEGRHLRCGQCRAIIEVALYRCSVCHDVIRCGKCSVSDDHHPGHPLVPFVIRSIERCEDGHSRAHLCHLSSIQDVHTLEALEMGANLPVGALSAHVASQRQMERSMARSIAAHPTTGGTASTSQRLGFNAPDFGSTTFLPDTECSTSTSQRPVASISNFAFGAREHSVSAESSAASPMQLGSGGIATAGSSVLGGGGSSLTAPPRSALLMQGQPPAPPPVGKGGLLKEPTVGPKKSALPKAEEIEDLTWEEELRQCREKELTELLLFNFGFTRVPLEVFTPPPLQVVFLDLSQNSISSLPNELRFLAHLRKLVVSYNKLTELPDSLGTLTELTSFDASHNALKDLPMTFIYLTNLQSCALDYNDFGCIPESILDILTPSAAITMGESAEEATGAGGGGGGASGDCVGSPDAPVVTGNSTGCAGGDAAVFDDGSSPALSVLYLAANDRIVALPPLERLRRFASLSIALDNEPSLYKHYYENDWETKLPNVTISWNKIYPDEIIPNLYCGGLRSAQSQMVYRKLNIRYVLTVGRGLTPVPPQGGKHKTIVVDDIPGADILSSISEAIEFIDESLNAGVGCVVHCFAGLSRSATTVIAYLMVRKKLRLDEAYLLAKKGRPAILPNDGFFGQLIRLDKQLYPDATRPLDIASLDRPKDENLHE